MVLLRDPDVPDGRFRVEGTFVCVSVAGRTCRTISLRTVSACRTAISAGTYRAVTLRTISAGGTAVSVLGTACASCRTALCGLCAHRRTISRRAVLPGHRRRALLLRTTLRPLLSCRTASLGRLCSAGRTILGTRRAVTFRTCRTTAFRPLALTLRKISAFLARRVLRTNDRDDILLFGRSALVSSPVFFCTSLVSVSFFSTGFLSSFEPSA